MRNIIFKNDYWYHVYNRGASKMDIFSDDKDFCRFLFSMFKFNANKKAEYNYKASYKNRDLLTNSIGGFFCDDSYNELVDIVCFCLNNNHYHILLKQKTDNGISKYMHKLDMGYTRYSNYKYNRSGCLMQGTYKAVYISSVEQLIYLSAYINGNSEIHKICSKEKWPWSSYNFYLFPNRFKNILTKDILCEFDSIEDYKDYVKVVVEAAKKRKEERSLSDDIFLMEF